jgi:hypothetical protein
VPALSGHSRDTPFALNQNGTARREGDIVFSTYKEMKMADKSSEDIAVEKRAAERAVAHKEMKLAVGTPAHHAAVKKHTLASEAHAKAVTVAQKAATRARR